MLRVISEHFLYREGIMKIKNIYNRESEFLKDAIKNGKNPYHTFAFTTIKNRYPESRTVVLRGFKLNPLTIFFNADCRSSKILELKANKYCSALFYNQERRVQLRFKCEALLHYQNNISAKVWSNTALQSRKCYMGPYHPSEALDEWHPNIPLEYLKTDPEREHSEQGYANFVHIELKIVELDVLELHHDGHIRFITKNGKDLHYIAP